MEPDFWRSRWAEGRTAFHQGHVNSFLARHHGVLGQARTVLVPLCGKAFDLEHLASLGHAVVGVELVEDAVRAFFAERGLSPQVSTVGPFTCYRKGSVSLFVGDFFQSTRALLGPLDALYDRAAVVALPEALRGRYVDTVRALLPVGSPGLVISMHYPQREAEGPPFSVPEAELRARYEGSSLLKLEEAPADGRFATFGERARELCFKLVR